MHEGTVKKNLTTEKNATRAALLVLLLITTTIFAFTVKVRAPWFGELQSNGHQFITGSTLMFVKSWVEDGILRDHFTLFQELRSASNEANLFLRFPYFTYPLGTFLPLFALTKLHIANITPATVMGWNLINQFLAVCALVATAFLALRKWNYSIWHATLFTLPVPIVALLLPGPMYWHQNTFFADQAVILPFCLLLLTETALWHTKTERANTLLRIAQGILLFWGTYTDWLFIFVTITFVLVRLFQGKLGKNFQQFIAKGLQRTWPALVAVVLYFLNVLLVTNIKILYDYFLFRAGLDADGQKFTRGHELALWTSWFPLAYGKVGQLLIIALTTILALGIVLSLFWVKKRFRTSRHTREFFSLLMLALFSCIAQATFFENHTVIHNFSALKFIVPLALFGTSLLPAFLLQTRFFKKLQRAHIVTALALVLILISALYAKAEFPRYKNFFGGTEVGPKIFGEAVDRNTTKKDVILSSTLLIDHTTPYAMTYADVKVEKVLTEGEATEKVRSSIDPHRIIVVQRVEDPLPAFLSTRTRCSEKEILDAGFRFTFVTPKNFLTQCGTQP